MYVFHCCQQGALMNQWMHSFDIIAYHEYKCFTYGERHHSLLHVAESVRTYITLLPSTPSTSSHINACNGYTNRINFVFRCVIDYSHCESGWSERPNASTLRARRPIDLRSQFYHRISLERITISQSSSSRVELVLPMVMLRTSHRSRYDRLTIKHSKLRLKS